MNLSYRLSRTRIDADSGAEALLLITISAPAARSVRQPVNLGIALDRSGSMSGEPLEIAKRALGQFVDQLLPSDRLTFVTFGDTAEAVVSAHDATDKAALRTAIAGIDAGGMTNLSAGWLATADLMLRHSSAKTYSRIVLLSDGLANAGVVDPDKLAGIATGFGKKGLPTTTIGVGAGYDDTVLASIAAQSGGNLHHLDTLDGVSTLLESEFEELVAIYAQNVVLEIAPDSSVLEAVVLHGYPVTYRKGGFSIACGDVVSGDDRYVLIRMRCGPKTGTQPLTGITLRYHKIVGDTALCEQTALVSIDRIRGIEATPIDTFVAKHLTIVKTAIARRAAAELAEKGDLSGASTVLSNAAADARGAGLETDALELERARETIGDDTMRWSKGMRTRASSRSRPRRSD